MGNLTDTAPRRLKHKCLLTAFFEGCSPLSSASATPAPHVGFLGVPCPTRSDKPHEVEPVGNTSGSRRTPPPPGLAPPVLTPAPLRTRDRHLLLPGPQPLSLPTGPLPLLRHLLRPGTASSGSRRPSGCARPVPGAPLTVLGRAWPWEEGTRDQQQREGQGAGERRARHPACGRPNREGAEAGAGAREGRGGREGAGESAKE